MEKRFICSYLPDKGMETWKGTICPMQPFDPVDYEVWNWTIRAFVNLVWSRRDAGRGGSV